MTEQELEKLVEAKFAEADKAFEDRPKKFFITQNGRGVVDGGELYNKVKETHNTLLRVERLLQEGGKKSVYNRLDDIEHYIASLDGQLNEIRQLLKNNDKKTEA